MVVVFTVNYFFSERRRSVDSETLLVIDFMNLKIKSTQYFKCAHRNILYVYILIELSTHTCMSTCVFLTTTKTCVQHRQRAPPVVRASKDALSTVATNLRLEDPMFGLRSPQHRGDMGTVREHGTAGSHCHGGTPGMPRARRGSSKSKLLCKCSGQL
jgi:hypothetical protein